jgi:hypothetical protein
MRVLVNEAVVDAVHPDFGWIWRDGELGGQLRQRLEAAELELASLSEKKQNLKEKEEAVTSGT